jgi:hypothetical protein
MKLRLVILTLLCAAVGAANAAAGQQLQTVARDGVKTTSRSASKSCGFENDYAGVGDLLMVCDGSKGRGQATYDFVVPKNLYGTPTMRVYGDRLCCASSSITTKLVHVTKFRYRIVVSVSKRTRFDVLSVSLSYYVKT